MWSIDPLLRRSQGVSRLYRAFGALLCALLFGAALGSLPVEAAEQAEGLRRRIDAVLSDKKLRETRVGARVIDASSGKVLYSLRANDLFIPASNAKIITSAAALHHLGGDFAFQTRIFARGTIRQGKILGDLVVWGSGDPNISGRFHDGDPLHLPRKWARAIAKRGIREIQGDIVMDDLAFDRQYRHPSWDSRQHHKWYQAPVGALSFNDNCIDLVIEPASQASQQAGVKLVPDTRYVQLENGLKTVNGGPAQVHITREAGSNRVVVTGSVPVGAGEQTYWVTAPEPALYLGTVFAETLSREGVKLAGTVRLAQAPTGISEKTAALLLEQRSTLRDTIPVMNQRSQNFYAECVLKCLGYVRYGRGTFANGKRAVADFLGTLGYRSGDFVFSDGSGLSREARLTPTILTDVMAAMYRSKHGKLFMESLAKPGEPGTLAKRMDDPELSDSVFAKTGYIRGVSVLSGYVRTRSEKVLVFSILMNELECPLSAARAQQDKVCEVLASY